MIIIDFCSVVSVVWAAGPVTCAPGDSEGSWWSPSPADPRNRSDTRTRTEETYTHTHTQISAEHVTVMWWWCHWDSLVNHVSLLKDLVNLCRRLRALKLLTVQHLGFQFHYRLMRDMKNKWITEEWTLNQIRSVAPAETLDVCSDAWSALCWRDIV